MSSTSDFVEGKNSAWDQSFNYLARLDRLLNTLHIGRYNKDYTRVFDTLTGLYNELYPLMLNDEEGGELSAQEKYYKDYQAKLLKYKNGSLDRIDFTPWERSLIKIMHRADLLIRKKTKDGIAALEEDF